MNPVAERIRSQTMELAARWEPRARELPELQHMSQPVLFDHLFELLEGLAAWIEGKHEAAHRAFDALLDGHALQRLGHGVSLKTLIAEYNQLRSILTTDLLALEATDQVRDSLVRLHHGFDQAVGACLHRYEQAREQQRERFIAVLGHDLRQPLGAITMSANLLADAPATAAGVRGRLLEAVAHRSRSDAAVTLFPRTRRSNRRAASDSATIYTAYELLQNGACGRCLCLWVS